MKMSDDDILEFLNIPYQKAVEKNGGWNIGNWSLECYAEYGYYNWYAVLTDENYKILKKILIAEKNIFYDEIKLKKI